MMTHPDFDKVWYGARGMKAGIEACVRSKCVVSAVTLIYSAVDALSALTSHSDVPVASRSAFKAWVRKYLLAELECTVTASDIYAARCGVVHTYSPVSDLSRRGEAKTIVYRWREGHHPADGVLAEHARVSAVIEIEDLADSLYLAVEKFQVDISEDPDLRFRVEHNIQGLLCYQPSTPIEIVLSPDSEAVGAA